jgi:hypothetical protein
MRLFCSFCERFGISTPFPVTEQLLCSFVPYLADKRALTSDCKIVAAAVRNAQLSLGLPDPRETSAFPILKRVQAGVSHLRLQQGDSARVRLPITAELLSRIRVALQTSSDPKRPLFWRSASSASSAWGSFYSRRRPSLTTVSTWGGGMLCSTIRLDPPWRGFT